MSSSMLDWFLNTLTPTEPLVDVPSTAEIIQKCLTVNPFDLKFREANMQISHAQDLPEQQRQLQQQAENYRNVFSNSQFSSNFVSGASTQTQAEHNMSSALPSMLKLPSLSSQSPGIFSNINVLSTDFEDELRKTINISRKLRESRDESKCEPRTADVIDGVIDVEFNRSNAAGFYQHFGSTSDTTISDSSNSHGVRSSLLSAQDLIQAAATAYGNQLAVSMHNAANISSSSTSATSATSPLERRTNLSESIICSPSTSLPSGITDSSIITNTSTSNKTSAFSEILSVDTRGNTEAAILATPIPEFPFSTSSLKKNSLSPSNLVAATTAAAFLGHQSVATASMVSRISPETLMALHSSAAAAVAAANSNQPSRLAVLPSSTASRSAGISPKSNLNSMSYIELKKTSSAVDLLGNGSGLSSIDSSYNPVSSVPSVASDNYDAVVDVKPTINKRLNQDQQHISVLSPQHGGQNFYQPDDHSSAFSSGASMTDLQESTQHKSKDGQQKDKSRKYTRYNNGNTSSGNDMQVSSTRGGRGRRSITNEMAPDERRSTILERNKAAAVRYRKRKKEEHDEMIGRVQELEQDNNSLQTRNLVLVREIERLAALLKTRDSNCVCRASQISVPNGRQPDTGHSPAMEFSAFTTEMHTPHRPDSNRP